MSYEAYIVVDVPEDDVETVARYEGFSVTRGPIVRFRYISALRAEDARQCLIYGADQRSDGQYFADRLSSGLHSAHLVEDLDSALAAAAYAITFHAPDDEIAQRLIRIVGA